MCHVVHPPPSPLLPPFSSAQVELPEGPLPQFSHDMEPFLRKQGLPVRLEKGGRWGAASEVQNLLCWLLTEVSLGALRPAAGWL